MKTTLAAFFFSIIALVSMAAQNPAAYRDPRGRFTLQVPAGWSTTQMNDDAVQLGNGSAYVTAMVLQGSEPALMMQSIARQTGGQWRDFTEVRRGDTRFGGSTGLFATYSGRNPKGVEAYLQLIAVTDGSSVYLLMTSAPQADFAKLKGAMDQIEQSFALQAPKRPANSSNSVPLPAGAINPPNSPNAPKAGTAAAPPAPPQPAAFKTAGAAPAAPSSSDYYHMKVARIVDEHGFERPMTAMTLLIPTDWQFQGSVQYNGAGCPANMVRLVFRATSPDGRFAIELMPGKTWQWAQDPNMVRMMQASNQQMAQFGQRGCDVMPPMTASDFLRRVAIPASRPNARVANIEPIPEIEPQIQEQLRQEEQMMAQKGIRVQASTDVRRARLTYSVNGQPVEEWLTAITVSAGTPGPSFNLYAGAGQTIYYTCGGDHIFALRAPQGQLDAKERFFLMVLATVRVDPQWQARVTQVIANISAQNSKGAMDRSAIITQSGHDINNMINQSYQNATKSREHAMEEWSQYMRGVQTYRNPNTGDTVELPNQYGHAWAGPNNEYVVTDSANFNPNVSLKGNWTSLEPVGR